jgi:hypothetical protein
VLPFDSFPLQFHFPIRNFISDYAKFHHSYENLIILIPLLITPSYATSIIAPPEVLLPLHKDQEILIEISYTSDNYGQFTVGREGNMEFLRAILSFTIPLLGMAAGIYLLKYGSEHRKRVVKAYGIIIIAIFSLLILSSIRLWLLILGY